MVKKVWTRCSWSPDVVLMDMGLPVLDGWEATSQAKADSELSSILVIALTAAMAEDREKRSQRADDFDTKRLISLVCCRR